MSYHSDLLPEKRQQRGRNSARPAPASSNYGCRGCVWRINQIGCRRAFCEGRYQRHVQQWLKEEQRWGSGGQGKVCQGAVSLKDAGWEGSVMASPLVSGSVSPWTRCRRGLPRAQRTLLSPAPGQHVSCSSPRPCSGERTVVPAPLRGISRSLRGSGESACAGKAWGEGAQEAEGPRDSHEKHPK